MLRQNRLSLHDFKELRTAALHLFEPQQVADLDFWRSLTLEQLKKAFREKARLYHPDLQGPSRPALLRKRQERFIVVKDSYDALKRFLGADVFKHFG